jgi:hypothetical protein
MNAAAARNFFSSSHRKLMLLAYAGSRSAPGETETQKVDPVRRFDPDAVRDTGVWPRERLAQARDAQATGEDRRRRNPNINEWTGGDLIDNQTFAKFPPTDIRANRLTRSEVPGRCAGCYA